MTPWITKILKHYHLPRFFPVVKRRIVGTSTLASVNVNLVKSADLSSLHRTTMDYQVNQIINIH